MARRRSAVSAATRPEGRVSGSFSSIPGTSVRAGYTVNDTITGTVHRATRLEMLPQPTPQAALEASAATELNRAATLSDVAKGALTADQAIVRVDTVRNLEALTNHAWRSAAHLVGLGK